MDSRSFTCMFVYAKANPSDDPTGNESLGGRRTGGLWRINRAPRQEMAKEPLLLDQAIKNIDEQSLAVLKRFSEMMHSNAIIINWHHPVFEGATPEALRNLYDLGLIHYALWEYSDELATITPRGLELLQKIDQNNQ